MEPRTIHVFLHGVDSHLATTVIQSEFHVHSRQFLQGSCCHFWLRIVRPMGATFYSKQIPVSLFAIIFCIGAPSNMLNPTCISSCFGLSYSKRRMHSELIDTFFIIIHKKPLIFLHWYHHITVLLYCWHSYVTKSPYGLYFVTMNYAVHAIMYGYYFLMAVKLKPKWLNAMFITGAQISQMVVGIVVTVFAFYFYHTENDERNPCFIQRENNIAAFIMYGSYLFLFMQFFTVRYQPRESRKYLKKID